MAWMVALPISTQESMEKVQPHGLVAPPLRLFTQSGAVADAAARPQDQGDFDIQMHTKRRSDLSRGAAKRQTVGRPGLKRGIRKGAFSRRLACLMCRQVRTSRHMPGLTATCFVTRLFQSRGTCLAWWPYASSHWPVSSPRHMPRVLAACLVARLLRCWGTCLVWQPHASSHRQVSSSRHMPGVTATCLVVSASSSLAAAEQSLGCRSSLRRAGPPNPPLELTPLRGREIGAFLSARCTRA